MAEFSEVCKQWKRMCIAQGSEYEKCAQCPAGNYRMCAFEISDIQDSEFQGIEEAIMAWAAEHPEPVYPTWVEWLIDKGVIPQEGCMLATVHDPDTGEITEARIGINPSALQPIPADTAGKLGIEPKEG